MVIENHYGDRKPEKVIEYHIVLAHYCCCPSAILMAVVVTQCLWTENELVHVKIISALCLSLTHSQEVSGGTDDMMAVVSSTPATSKDDSVS